MSSAGCTVATPAIIASMRCCIDASRPDAVSAIVVGHAALIFARGDRYIGEIVEGRALHLGGIDRLRNQIDRQAGDFTAVLAAQQLSRSAGRGAEPRGGR